MKEKLKQEAVYYLKLNNEKWGCITGAVLGLSVGIYVVASGELTGVFANQALELLVKITAIPASTGLFSTFFKNTGAAVDVITHEATALSWVGDRVHYCVNAYKDRRDQNRFFMDGAPYRRRNRPEEGSMVLRHLSSEISDGHTIAGTSSEDSSPRAHSRVPTDEFSTIEIDPQQPSYQNGHANNEAERIVRSYSGFEMK